MRDRPLMAFFVEGGWRGAALAFLLALPAGCSGIKSYPDRPEKNLKVHTRIDSGSMFSSVRASLSISKVDAQS